MVSLLQNIKEGSNIESEIRLIISRLYESGPVSRSDMEVLSYIKLYQPEIFSKYEKTILNLMGLFFKEGISDKDDLRGLVCGLMGDAIELECGKRYTPMQANLRESILNQQVFSFSSATSTGKSYVFRDIIQKYDQNIAIIVPSRALINEYFINVREMVDKTVNVLTFADIINTDIAQRSVFILTPERARELFRISNLTIGLALFDEAQMVDDDQHRGIYFDSIVRRMRKHFPDAKMLFAHPFIENPEAQIERNSLGSPSDENSRNYEFNNVGQLFTCVDNERKFWDFALDKGRLSKYKNLIDYDPVRRCIENKGSVLIYTTKASIYNGEVFDDLDDYISQLCNVDDDAIEIIKSIEELIGGSSNEDSEHYSDLLALLYKGVVIHHGSLPLNVRYLVEEFVRNGHCRICFATSTLYQGINMPFDIVYIKRFKNNPLFIKNLVGRAGRSTKRPEFDFGRVIVNQNAMSKLRDIYGVGVKISNSSNIDTDNKSDDADIKEFKDAIRSGQLNDNYGLTYQQVERLNKADNDVYIENIINNILDNNGNFDTKKYKDLAKRKIVTDNFSKLYAVYLKGRQPTDAEFSVIRTAVEVFLQQISGHSLRSIVSSRFAYIAKTSERRMLRRNLPDSVYRLKCNKIYPAYSTPAPKSGLPNKDLKEYPLFSIDKYRAHEVSYDLVMYDTYDYIDKIWGFCLSDIFYAVFDLYYERTQDVRADKMRKLIRYATVDEKEILLLRYGFLFEDIEWIKPLVIGIDEKRIKFGDISNLSEKQKGVISRYIPDE